MILGVCARARTHAHFHSTLRITLVSFKIKWSKIDRILSVGPSEISHFHIFKNTTLRSPFYTFKFLCFRHHCLALSIRTLYIWLLRLVISLSCSNAIINNIWKICHGQIIWQFSWTQLFDNCHHQNHLSILRAQHIEPRMLLTNVTMAKSKICKFSCARRDQFDENILHVSHYCWFTKS